MKSFVFFLMALATPLVSHADGIKVGEVVTFKVITTDDTQPDRPVIKTCLLPLVAKGPEYANQPQIWKFESLDQTCWGDTSLYIQPDVGRGSYVSIDEYMKSCGTSYPYPGQANTWLISMELMGQTVQACRDNGPVIFSAASPINVISWAVVLGRRAGKPQTSTFVLVDYQRQ